MFWMCFSVPGGVAGDPLDLLELLSCWSCWCYCYVLDAFLVYVFGPGVVVGVAGLSWLNMNH